MARAAPPAPKQRQAFQIGFPALALRPELWLIPYPNSLLPVSTSKCGLTALLQTRSAPSSQKSLPRPLGPRIPSCPQEPQAWGLYRGRALCHSTPPPTARRCPGPSEVVVSDLGAGRGQRVKAAAQKGPCSQDCPHSGAAKQCQRALALREGVSHGRACLPLWLLGSISPVGPPGGQGAGGVLQAAERGLG